MTTTIVPDAFVFTEWPSKRLDNKDDTGKSEEAPARDLCRYNNQLYSEMPVSETVELPGSLLLFCLPSSFVCLLSWPFGEWYCFRAQISPDKQSSGWHKVYEDYYIQKNKQTKKRWLSKETSSLMVLDNSFFRRAGGLFLSPSVTCSNALQVLETHRLCHIDHCTVLLTGYL